jgi:hypothetical protein
MDRGSREQRRRDRLRDYEARLEATRRTVAVLAEFAQARESRAPDRPLEAEFAAVGGDAHAASLPAAVWVALRQADLDAVVEILVQAATEQFKIAEHEELGSDYRLTAVTECRGVPDVDRLIAQVAAFLQVPRDVLAVIAGWGPDDPRTLAEIDRLLDPRYGHPASAAAKLRPAPTGTSGPAATVTSGPAATGIPAPPATDAPAHASVGSRARLTLTRAELATVLALTPDQRDVFTVLTREADILICAE